MRKLFLLGIVLVSCQPEKKEVWKEHREIIVVKDSVFMDSIIKKATDLIISTQNSYQKVERIKQISNENIVLKKELIETKAELKEVKLALDSVAKPKKRNLIQKIVDNFKDTIN
jgi:hypothetical protein